MRKALFFNVPAHGHINPSLPLVTELVRRGHQITYFASGNYRASIEAAGAIFQPYATVHDDYFVARGLSGSVPQKAACALLTTAEEILPELLEFARVAHPDYILFDGMCPWGYWVARILGLPAVASLSLLPLMSPPLRALLDFSMLRIIVPMIFSDFGKGMEANCRSQALGKKYNVPPLGPTSLLNASGDIAISYTSKYFQPFANTVSPTVRFVGRTISQAAVNQVFPFEQAAGRRVVYLSLGTLNNADAAFFQRCITAFADSDDFLIISTGNHFRPDSFGALSANITVQSWVPQLAVLKRASLFITHGGLNSVHDGLYFGVPLLLVPQQGEQSLIARRVVELGAGLMLEKAQVNVENLRAHCTRLLSEPRFKAEAQQIGETLRTAGGVVRAADEIEMLLRSRHPIEAKDN